jgi:hypothetical protein
MTRKALVIFTVLIWAAVVVSAQLADAVIEPAHPAISYGGPATDRVEELNRRLMAGDARLDFEARAGYLRGLLTALDIPVESQIALFSGTSLQARLISARNPRTIFFNDSISVAWIAGGFIEVASHDPRQGAVFYLLPQQAASTPQLFRDTRCLACHYSFATLGVPGFLVRSIPSGRDGSILPWLGNYLTDHRSPLEERWGGWYVTGRGGGRHLGNAPVAERTLQELRVEDANLNVATLTERFEARSYLSPLSDIVALLVFNHQMRMMNLITRLGWESRTVEYDHRPDAAAVIVKGAAEVVDYLLFVDEAPLDGIRGTLQRAWAT